MSKLFFDRQAAFQLLRELRFFSLAERAEALCAERFRSENHGNIEGWKAAWSELPEVDARFDSSGDSVRIIAADSPPTQTIDRSALQQTLMRFHPWRKGPLEVLGIPIDTEWKSCWKWSRFAPHVNFDRQRVLDVGGGNGYYGWKMIEAGASLVVGCEPFLLSIAQFEVFRRYWPDSDRHMVLPLADVDLPRDIERFDITCSMGVLYHRPNPIEHLQILGSTLRPGGQLLLETIVLEQGDSVLVPEDRYAKMRNVWFIPSVPMLERWLRRTGFTNLRVLDVSRTTTDEQRRTPWMTFESLSDFLDPNDSHRTMEGYPAPTRAVILADKK